MRIKQLRFNNADLFHVQVDRMIIFVKPLRSSLYRVFQLPTGMDDKLTEIREVLNGFCTRFYRDVWYFLDDPDAMQDITDTLTEMDILAPLVRLETDPEYSN